MALQQFDERIIFNGNSWYGDNNVADARTSLIYANGYDIRLDIIQFANTDTADHKMLILLNGTAPLANVVELTVPARAGYDGTLPVDLLGIWMPAAQHFVLLQTFAQLFWQCHDVIPAGEVVTAYYQGGSV